MSEIDYSYNLHSCGWRHHNKYGDRFEAVDLYQLSSDHHNSVLVKDFNQWLSFLKTKTCIELKDNLLLAHAQVIMSRTSPGSEPVIFGQDPESRTRGW